MENSKDLLCDVYLKLNSKRQKGVLIYFKLKTTFIKQILLSTYSLNVVSFSWAGSLDLARYLTMNTTLGPELADYLTINLTFI